VPCVLSGQPIRAYHGEPVVNNSLRAVIVKELLEILTVAERIRAAGQPCAVATVVKIGGSTYRRPGARMLVDGEGQTWGTISGGCLEGEVAQQALVCLKEGSPRLLSFELGEDDLVLGFGTGCGGIVHVFIEPVQPDAVDSVLDLLARCIESRQSGMLVTVIDEQGTLPRNLGRHLLLPASGDLSGGLTDPSLQREVLVAAQRLLEVERTKRQTYLWHTLATKSQTGRAEMLLEIVRAPIRLFVFGDGHDVRAMVRVARQMGWQVVVVGRKPPELLAERFPEADEHVFLMHPKDVMKQIAPDARSAALVMNHTYVRDRALMAALLKSSVPYVGMLGPAARTARMIEELKRDEAPPGDDQLARLFGPVGLDIGTETPEEIALASAAEIQAVLHNRSGGHLRERAEPIHNLRDRSSEYSA